MSESEVDGAFDAAEQADWDMMADFGLTGVAQGLVATQHAPTADLTIDITAGVAYDANGQRIEIGSGQTVDMSVDSDSNSTAVGSGGNSKVLSLFVYAERTLSDPRVDGNSNTVQFSRAETFAFKVVQGNEATTGTETPPALEGDKILICDVTIDNAQTQILNADINSNAVGGNRRQDAFVATAGSIEVRAGTPEDSDQAIVTELNNHVTGVANAHPATAITAAIAATWHDAATIVGTDVDAVLEEIVTDLTNAAGSDRIGAAAHTAAGDGLNDLAAGSIQDQLRSLADATCAHASAQNVGGDWTIAGNWSLTGEFEVAAAAYFHAATDGAVPLGIGPTAATRHLRRFERVHTEFMRYYQPWQDGAVVGDFAGWEISAGVSVSNGFAGGALVISTGTTINTQRYIVQENPSLSRRDGKFICEWLIYTGTNVSDIQIEVGVKNTGGSGDVGTEAEACCARYDTSTDSFWTLVGVQNSTTTTDASDVAPATQNWQRLTIEVDGDGSAELFIDGVSKATLATGAVGQNDLATYYLYAVVENKAAADKLLSIVSVESWCKPGLGAF